MSKKNNNFVVEEMSPEVKATHICPECGSLLVVRQYGLYEEAVCVGCGYTETSQPTSPAII